MDKEEDPLSLDKKVGDGVALFFFFFLLKMLYNNAEQLYIANTFKI